MSRNKETKIILYCLVFCSLKYLFLWKCFEVSHGTWWKTILKKRWVLRMRNQTSDLWIPPSNALPLSHRDSTVSEVFYKVHMTCILHTSRISNVDSVMFVGRNSRDGKFWAWKRNKKDVFCLVTRMGQRKNSLSPWGIKPQTFGFHAPMLYHWATDSTVSEVYYEVHMTHVQHNISHRKSVFVHNVSLIFVY